MQVSICIACPESEIWREKIHAIKPDALKLTTVWDCGKYIDIGLYATAGDISLLMKAIVDNDMGSPELNRLDGNSFTETHLYVGFK